MALDSFRLIIYSSKEIIVNCKQAALQKSISMKKNRDIWVRLQILDSILGSNLKLSKSELLISLNNGLEAKGLEPIKVRALDNDIQFLRDKYQAPINRPSGNRPGYYYTELFSIQSQQLNDEEIETLRTGMDMIKGALGNLYNQDFGDILLKLESRVNSNESQFKWIEYEQQSYEYSAMFLEELSIAIRQKTVLTVFYKPFNLPEYKIEFHPYLIKEYRNRWFAIGWNGASNKIVNLAFDRIIKIKPLTLKFHQVSNFNSNTFFEKVVGVSVPYNLKCIKIKIKPSTEILPYIITKPIHKNQIIEKVNNEIIITLDLIPNKELNQILLGFGSHIEILGPQKFRNQFKKEIESMLSLYK